MVIQFMRAVIPLPLLRHLTMQLQHWNGEKRLAIILQLTIMRVIQPGLTQYVLR